MAKDDKPDAKLIIEWDGVPVVEARSKLAEDNPNGVLDVGWAKNAFLVKSIDLEPTDVRNRGFTSAFFKFTDTSLGGSLCINPKPQFTRYADVRVKGRLQTRNECSISSRSGNLGMGRYYSESIDDHSQVINIRFGVPHFNSMTTFFNGFYNYKASRLAKNGESDGFGSLLDLSTSVASLVGSAIGLVTSIVVFPIIMMSALGTLGRWAFGKPTSKFYYLKPTMLTYWTAVNTLVNRIGLNRGLLPVSMTDKSAVEIGKGYKFDQASLEGLHSLMPDVFSSSGGFDIFAAANKAQRVSVALQQTVYKKFAEGSAGGYKDYDGYVEAVYKGGEYTLPPVPPTNLFAMTRRWLETEVTKPSPESGENADVNAQPNGNGTGDTNTTQAPPSDPNNTPTAPAQWGSFLDAEWNNGSAFACFRVDYTGSVSESFSNSVGENDLAGKINGMTSQARAATFTFAGGNLANVPVVGAMVSGVVDVAKSFIDGVASGLNINGLVAFAGAAFVDIPKHWQSSTAQITHTDYTMHLTSPYGNAISQMINMDIPLCMLLAGALPISTGKQSYTSPFILELYDKGRCQTRLGMIDRISVTRGSGNLGFNKNGKAMAYDISFSVVDMSSVVHMPIAGGGFFDGDGMFDDQTVFSDYMAVLAGQGLYEQLYFWPKLKLSVAQGYRKVEALLSPAKWAMIVHDKTPVGMLDFLFRSNTSLK